MNKTNVYDGTVACTTTTETPYQESQDHDPLSLCYATVLDEALYLQKLSLQLVSLLFFWVSAIDSRIHDIALRICRNCLFFLICLFLETRQREGTISDIKINRYLMCPSLICTLLFLHSLSGFVNFFRSFPRQ